ncbi:MAG: phospholipid carrier-dependent glycosyltransferase [Anaerolineaceae bacterium]|nr:MAG: phospholipid carrier-dependent glycosyltransferase [Anaerolineaceae bacterium]
MPLLPPRPLAVRAALILLLALGGLLRLLDLTDPPLDFQPSRQLRNSLVARDIYFRLLPDTDAKTLALTESFRRSVGQYEPPIIESLVAVTYRFTGGENYAAPRLWGTLFWLLAGLALYDLIRRATSEWSALAALTFYLVLPFSVQASRSFQPDPLMTSAFVIGIYFLYRWSESTIHDSQSANSRFPISWRFALLAGIFLGFAALVKIVIAFFVGVAAIALVLFTLRKDFWKSTQVWAMAALMVLPALIFYVFLNSNRSTEYFFSWSVALFKLITSIHFYADWLGFIGSLFGLTVIFASVAGVFLAPPRLRWLLIGLWIGYEAYGLTLPFQMYTHSYYHIQLIPILALGLASVLNPILEAASAQSLARRAAFIAVILALVGYQSWVARSVLVSEDFRHEPAFWESVGQSIPADADTIGLTQDYGYRLMLWGWRKVTLWPLSTDLAATRNSERDLAARFDELTVGKEYFLVTAFNQLDKQPDLKKILDGYPIAAEGNGFMLYDLHP